VPFKRSIPSTRVEQAVTSTPVENDVKGRPFVVCIAPVQVLKGKKYEKLRSMICNGVHAKVAEVWNPNQHWTAPEPYRREAGSDLVNIVLVFNRPCSRNDLPDIKRKTNQIEDFFRKNGLRRVNLNPGLALPEGVLVASRKPKEGREPLSEDVWGQLVLECDNDRLRPSPYTFDEYTDAKRLVKFGRLCGVHSRKPTQTGSALSLLKTNRARF